MKSLIKILLAVAVVAVLVAGAVKVWRDRDHTIDVVANFDSTSGLYEGNAVAVLGMTVGKVTSIKSRGSYVEVGMEIDADTPVPADVTAVTVSTSVLTDRHVELTPVYDGGPRLQAHQIIDKTRVPVELDRTLAMSQKLAVSLQGDGEGGGPVADLLSTAAAITDGNGPDIRAALTTLSKALAIGDDGGDATGEAITKTVNNLSALPQAAADNDALIRSFGSSVQQISDLFADQRIGWGTTGAQINAILGEATDILTTRRDDMAQTVTGAQAVTKTLVDYRRQLQEFLNVTPLLMDNVWNVIDIPRGAARVHGVLDHVFTHGTLMKEICNVLQMKDRGCATGTPKDFGPDFGLSSMLEGLAK